MHRKGASKVFLQKQKSPKRLVGFVAQITRPRNALDKVARGAVLTQRLLSQNQIGLYGCGIAIEVMNPDYK